MSPCALDLFDVLDPVACDVLALREAVVRNRRVVIDGWRSYHVPEAAPAEDRVRPRGNALPGFYRALPIALQEEEDGLPVFTFARIDGDAEQVRGAGCRAPSVGARVHILRRHGGLSSRVPGARSRANPCLAAYRDRIVALSGAKGARRRCSSDLLRGRVGNRNGYCVCSSSKVATKRLIARRRLG